MASTTAAGHPADKEVKGHDNNALEAFCNTTSKGNGTTQSPSLTTKGKGKGTAPPPPPATKGKGKCSFNSSSAFASSCSKGRGKGNHTGGRSVESTLEDTSESASKAPSGPPLNIIARLLDGREIELCVGEQDLGQAVKHQISQKLDGISSSRLKLVVATSVFSDFTTVSDCGISDGDIITVIILSPLHGSLNRSGLEVPLDVMEMKMDVCEALSKLRPIRAA
jgi:hypothetical protein